MLGSVSCMSGPLASVAWSPVRGAGVCGGAGISLAFSLDQGQFRERAQWLT